MIYIRITCAIVLICILSSIVAGIVNLGYAAAKNAEATRLKYEDKMWRVTHKDQVWETSKRVRHWSNTTEFETEDGREITIVGDAVTEMYSKKE